jgi:hypothetical protein
MSRYTITEEPIDPHGVQEVLARQDEPLGCSGCTTDEKPPRRPTRRENVFAMARRVLKRLDRAAYSRSE